MTSGLLGVISIDQLLKVVLFKFEHSLDGNYSKLFLNFAYPIL